MPAKEDILKQLSAIIDPDFKKDIVSLGFVKNINIKEDHVSLDIELTTPACPIKTEFQRAAEKLLLALPGVKTVNVNMTSRKIHQENTINGLKQVQSIIAVASCKGGVGKSTVAANIARELSQRGLKTGLLDADLFGPSIPTLFGIHRPEVTMDQNDMINPLHVNGLKLMSFGFLLPEGPAIMRGPMVSGYIQQLLNQVKWGELDYLVIDMPPGTGDIQLTITQTVRLTGAVIVTTRQSLSLVDVEKGIEMFEKVNVPMLGICENMSYFVCDQCDKKHFIFGGDSKTSLTEKYGLETLVQIPINQDITSDLHKPKSNPFITELVDQMIRAQGKRSIESREIPKFSFNEKEITLEWPDSSKTKISNKKLRSNCGCANCVDEYSGKRIVQESDIPADIHALSIDPLGNYALRISWSDGHNTGIYPYELFKKLSL